MNGPTRYATGGTSMTFISPFCSAQLQAPDLAACVRLLLLAPALEECVVRAGLQEWMTRQVAQGGLQLPQAAPVLASTAVFGLLHLGAGWQQALAVLAPGLALALLYQRTHSWRWCALAHGAMNAFALSVCGL
jgi:membrane protease YdiL (CAAX protease family)